MIALPHCLTVLGFNGVMVVLRLHGGKIRSIEIAIVAKIGRPAGGDYLRTRTCGASTSMAFVNGVVRLSGSDVAWSGYGVAWIYGWVWIERGSNDG